MDGLPDNNSKSKSAVYAAENLAPIAVPVMHSRQKADSSKTSQPTDVHIAVPVMVNQQELSMDPALFGKGGQLQLRQARDSAQEVPGYALEIPPLFYSITAANVLEIPQVIAPKPDNTLEIPSEKSPLHPMEPQEKQ
jgi:hypothetical protein